MGIDPTTHKPKTNTLFSSQQKDTANLSHIAQWESARLEAEARESKKMSITIPFRNKPTFQPPCLDILKVWQGIRLTKSGANLSPTSNGTLLSPTSTLNFSDNMFTHPITACFGANFSPLPVVNSVENSKYEVGVTEKENVLNVCTGNPNDDGQLGVGNTSIQLYDIEYPNQNNAAAVTYVTEDSLTHLGFMEGIASILSTNADEDGHNPMVPYRSTIEGSFNGDLEDNKDYWNNILNDAATSAYGSPVF